MQQNIEICEYTPAWALEFERLREIYARHLQGLAFGIEHVGSTSVLGLAAKPIIDIDIIIEQSDRLPEIAQRLAALGYTHQGDWGIVGREVFRPTSPLAPDEGNNIQPLRHNLYVCLLHSISLRNHLTLRDTLRKDPEKRAAYAELKKQIAAQTNNISLYVEAKTAFITDILRQAGFGDEALSSIIEANKAPKIK